MAHNEIFHTHDILDVACVLGILHDLLVARIIVQGICLQNFTIRVYIKLIWSMEIQIRCQSFKFII